MATASPSIGVIRAQVRAIRNKAPNAKVFGIFAPGRWAGPVVQGAGNDQIAIYQCDSPLQMRLALQNAPDTASATVLVTPLDQGKVSDDILLRLALRKLHPINNWEIVRSLFKAKHLDPRITRYKVLAEMLLEDAGNREFQPVAGGLVDADTVWGILLTERVGLSGAHPDLVELLRCTAESDLAVRWNACTTEFRKAAMAWIAEAAGDAASTVLGCIEGEHGSQAVAIGLVMGIVYHDAIGHELDKAAGRLEAYVGTTNLPTEIAKRWRDTAVTAAAQLSKPTLRRCLDEAEVILQNIGATSHAWRSGELESGFEQRLTRFGQALAAHVDARATAISEELQNVYGSLQQHRLGRGGGRRMQRAAMAIRLARWLADQNTGSHATPSNLLAIAQAYAGDGGFVDWARRVLRGGEPNKGLAGALVRLVDRVTELRESENLKFGQALVAERAKCGAASGLVPVERMLEQIVVKAAEKSPVLLLLVDGMSWAVFRELVSDIKSHDWIELGFDPSPKRLIGLAALPSVTEVCRTSLLCGALKRGQAFDEVQGFTAHPALVAASQPGSAPKLFHKAALEGDEDSSLAADIRDVLADKKRRVVGIVINAVDDHLDKGDQIDVIWTMQHIRVLEPILAEARAASRLVVLLSDHGHILDRQTECCEATDGLRWRRPGGSVRKDELEVSSSRVVLPDGGHVIVPWSERLRYGAKKNGYHGGGTPQEMLIPISILWPGLDLPEGLGELPVELPSWWTEPTVARPVAAVVEQPVRPTRRKVQPPTLFDQLKAPAAAPEEPWIKALLQSEVFTVQKTLAGRVRIDDVVLQRLLQALVSRGGSMTVPALAGAIEVPEHRLPGLLAVMQRLLNVEGYAILDRQDAANTVVLNIPLLKKQFELNDK
ncbi:MAG: BREX-2 system phosphatase PglZ [Pirellulaceae bacterium]